MNKICLATVEIALAAEVAIATFKVRPISARDQISRLSKLSDLQLTDWTFEALRSLARRPRRIAC